MTVFVAITGRVAAGKLDEAAEYLGKYVETIKKMGGDVQLLGEVGEINCIRTVTNYESLAEMEKSIEACWGSEDYRKLMDSAAGLFVEADTKVWKTTN
jgi:hypothetical protein